MTDEEQKRIEKYGQSLIDWMTEEVRPHRARWRAEALQMLGESQSDDDVCAPED